MHYAIEIARLLGDVIERLQAVDALTRSSPGHRLDQFDVLTERLAAIQADLLAGTRMSHAIRKTNELNMRLISGTAKLGDPRYRSLLASLLGQYKREGSSESARLGGLRGGRPRKDGKPTQTLERKGYTLASLPARKSHALRVHPSIRPAAGTSDPRG